MSRDDGRLKPDSYSKLAVEKSKRSRSPFSRSWWTVRKSDSTKNLAQVEVQDEHPSHGASPHQLGDPSLEAVKVNSLSRSQSLYDGMDRMGRRIPRAQSPEDWKGLSVGSGSKYTSVSSGTSASAEMLASELTESASHDVSRLELRREVPSVMQSRLHQRQDLLRLQSAPVDVQVKKPSRESPSSRKIRQGRSVSGTEIKRNSSNPKSEHMSVKKRVNDLKDKDVALASSVDCLSKDTDVQQTDGMELQCTLDPHQATGVDGICPPCSELVVPVSPQVSEMEATHKQSGLDTESDYLAVVASNARWLTARRSLTGDTAVFQIGPIDADDIEPNDSHKRRSLSIGELNVDKAARGHIPTGDKKRTMTRHHSSSCVLEMDKNDFLLYRALFTPKSPQQLRDVLDSGTCDVDKWNTEGLAPIHAIVLGKHRDKADILLALLTNSEADVNLQSMQGNTALHLAVTEGNELCVKILISFGADVNEPGSNEFTPLDLAINNGKVPSIESILLELGGKGSAAQMFQPHLGQQQSTEKCDNEYAQTQRLLGRLQLNLNRCMSFSKSLGGIDEAVAIFYQQKEIAHYNKTVGRASPRSIPGIMEGGSRVLFLDGGGIKGLVEIEVLMQIEERTGKRIVELFDWIVGTSTGAIIALGLVYAKKTLRELRKLFFMLKDKVFANARLGFAYNSSVLDDILQGTFGTDMCMNEVIKPRVLILAVDKSTTQLELCFFNNCFDNDYSKVPVWKVARYTSAAPMFFTECDNYVDGGVLANNPCECGLTEIQNFARQKEDKVSISVIISVGTGIYPAEVLGKVDAQKFLFFGKHWLKMNSLMKRAQNLMLLLSNALVNSEIVARNCESRCKEQGIPYFRFSPKLDEVIAAGEVDTKKLIDMIIQTKIQTVEQHIENAIRLLCTLDS